MNAPRPAVRPAVRRNEAWRFKLACLLGVACGAYLAYLALAKAPRPSSARGGAEFGGEALLILPPSASAGSSLHVDFGPLSQANGSVAALVVTDSYGQWALRSTVSGGWARFNISSDRTRDAGKWALRASAGRSHAESVLDVMPLAAVDPIVPLVGPRSIVADGEHTTMVVVIAVDKYGNPVADGTQVDVRASHPTRELEHTSAAVSHGLAWLRLRSRTVAGVTDVSAMVEGRQGPRADLLEVPGWPSPFSLDTPTIPAPADGREWVTLHSGTVADAHGNVLPDGSAVTVVATAGDLGRHVVQGYVVDGRVKVHLQTPPLGVPLAARAGGYGFESKPVDVPLAPAAPADGFPVRVDYDAKDDAFTFRAGPLVGPSRHFIPDGMDVWFAVQGSSGGLTRLRGEVDNGYAKVAVPRGTIGTHEVRVKVTVGGSSSEVIADAGPSLRPWPVTNSSSSSAS